MIWTTWRQLRTQAWVTAAALGLLGVGLLVTGVSLTNAYTTLGVGTCGDDCSSAVSSFLTAGRTGFPGVVHQVAGFGLQALPALLGVFWGAPLVARELETGTYRVAWTQSVTRGRWLTAKLGVTATVAAVATGLLAWGVTRWAYQVDLVDAGRVEPLVFGARGIVPVAYALFAFLLGVTLGLLVRRTVPAMAATLGIYAVVWFVMNQWVRRLLVAPVTLTRPLDTAHLDTVGLDPASGLLTVRANTDDIGGWVLSSVVRTPGGQTFAVDPATSACGPSSARDACFQWLDSHHLVQTVTYHPESQFWTLQWVESGIFVGLAVLLAAFCFRRLRTTW